jgi:glycosyltransferase involved in cell wall biosynthesis
VPESTDRQSSSPARPQPPEISVVVPFRNGRTDLPQLLERLTRQTLAADRYEVIMVDDCSTDDSAEWLRKQLAARSQPPVITLISSAQHGGSYAARNLALPKARADALAFTDADCQPDPAWLERGLAALADSPRVAGAIVLERSRPDSIVEMIDASRFLRQEHFVANEGFGATANLFVRREVFTAVGEFDASLQSGGDYEFGQRAGRGGFPITYAADASVRHHCRRTLTALFRKAHRVGFGFGQAVRLGRFSYAEVKQRIIDRATLSSGRHIDSSGDAPLQTQQRVAIAACHLAMAGFTAAGVARGLVIAR